MGGFAEVPLEYHGEARVVLVDGASERKRATEIRDAAGGASLRTGIQGDPRRGFWIAFAIILVVLVTLGIHRVSMEYRVLNAGFSKADAAQQNRKLNERRKRINVEIAATKRLLSIQEKSRTLHKMHFPDRKERTVVTMPGDGR